MIETYAGSERLLALMFRALEHALGDARDGLLLTFAMIVVDGQRGLVRFLGATDEAIAAARVHIGGAGPWTERWAVAYDGWASPEGETACRAVVIEAGEVGDALGWRLIQRYERTESGPLVLLGLPEFLGRPQQLLEAVDYH